MSSLSNTMISSTLSPLPSSTADEALMDLHKAIELDPDNKPVKAGDFPSSAYLILS